MTSIISYEEIKNFYEEFKKNPPADGFTKFYKEFSYMKTLIEMAKNQGLKEEAEQYEKIQKNAVSELEKLGYKFI